MRAVKASSIFIVLLILATSLVELACQSATKPSVLVVAVDDLSVLDMLCSEDASYSHQSGIKILCKESVRFTHAFNVSPMSVPTLTSILTGLYPFQHHVRNNGAPALNPQFVTVAEKALAAKYRTAFFSGGPPVLRKSGLNQGFELFDDMIVPARQSLYRNFKKTSTQFLQWLKNDVGNSSPFFAMIYVPDLIFTNTVTVNELGEARNLSHESQLDEFDNNLFNLIKELKNQNRWNQTTLILVGLNGHTDDNRPSELSPSNLHSENTQIALFIKPQQKARDMALQWKIDRNVSLVDLGETLFSLIETSENPNNTSSIFPSYSLISVLHQPQPDWPENRLILLESDWPRWRGLSNRRYAVLNQHTLFINDEPQQIFNTLTDRFETNPIRSSELATEERQRILQALNEIGADPWLGLKKPTLQKYAPAFYRWLRSHQKKSLLKDLQVKTQNGTTDVELVNWCALLAFDIKDWATMRNLAIKFKQPFWLHVAEKNSGIESKNHFSLQQDPCLRLLESTKIDSADMKACEDTLFLDFIDWQRAELRGLSKSAQKRRFERAYLNSLIDQETQEAALATMLIWDLPAAKSLQPRLTDLVLSLPEYQKQRTILHKALQNSAQWQDGEN